MNTKEKAKLLVQESRTLYDEAWMHRKRMDDAGEDKEERASHEKKARNLLIRSRNLARMAKEILAEERAVG